MACPQRTSPSRYKVSPLYLLGGWAVVLLIAILAPASVAAQGGSAWSNERLDVLLSDLETAEDAWVYGDYAYVVELLEAPLLADPPPPLDEFDMLRALTRLGASAFYVDRTELMDRAFLAALLLDPDYELDPLLYPPQVTSAFRTVRDDNASLLAPLREVESTPGATIYVAQQTVEQPRLVSMAPFGIGFFRSGRDLEGTLYLLSESAMATTSVVMFVLVENSRNQDGVLIPNDQLDRRRRVQSSTGWLFFGLVVANAIHGAISHESVLSTEYETFTEPPDNWLEREDDSRSSRRWQFRFAPVFITASPTL